MYLDRHLQLNILESLREHYPEVIEVSDLPDYPRDSHFMGNLFYLEAHGLIQAHAKRTGLMGVPSEIITTSITADGLDFLEDDGGIGAALKTITVRFNPDDLRQLITAKIENSDIEPQTKNSIIETIKQLPAEGLKLVSERLIGLGLDHGPDVYHQLQAWLT